MIEVRKESTSPPRTPMSSPIWGVTTGTSSGYGARRAGPVRLPTRARCTPLDILRRPGGEARPSGREPPGALRRGVLPYKVNRPAPKWGPGGRPDRNRGQHGHARRMYERRRPVPLTPDRARRGGEMRGGCQGSPWSRDVSCTIHTSPHDHDSFDGWPALYLPSTSSPDGDASPTRSGPHDWSRGSPRSRSPYAWAWNARTTSASSRARPPQSWTRCSSSPTRSVSPLPSSYASSPGRGTGRGYGRTG